jgi:NACHT domain
MRDTRKEVLQEIHEWASNPSCEERILWLHGIPGSGKTSVATSLCDMLHSSKNLGASFFCRRDDPIRSKPGNILCTLIHYLASTWGPYRRLVTNALHADSMLHPNRTQRIFEVLVEKPLEALGKPPGNLERPLASLDRPPPRPLVIVVDALDEYGDYSSRRTEAYSKPPLS